jgi:cytidylate kinase
MWENITIGDMAENVTIGKTRSFIEHHFGRKEKENIPTPARPAVTISRLEGAGGLTVASELANYLRTHTAPPEEWTVFSQHIVAKVLEEYRHQKSVGDFMKEDHKGWLKDAFEEFLGLHPSTWTLVEQTNETILRLAQIGNVILVGRGGNVVTSKLPNVFHVHLIGSLEKRIDRAQKVFGLDQKAAAGYISKKDEARRRYLKDNFDKDINDPLLYHMIINTDLVPYDEAARLIGNEVIARFKLSTTGEAVH